MEQDVFFGHNMETGLDTAIPVGGGGSLKIAALCLLASTRYLNSDAPKPADPLLQTHCLKTSNGK